jgi:glycosyltransferase involved in cell wall biosynthesis
MLLSLVIPVFNEEEVLPITLGSLREVLKRLHWEYEILFIDDGSRDGSLEYLGKQAAVDPRVKVLSFSRNFGHQAAVTAGLDFAAGDAVIVMDADLQDPPQLIPEMLRLHEQGFDIVSPRRVSRDGETPFKKATAALFYRLMKKMVDQRMSEDVGDFRLLSARAVIALRQFREQHRFMRGMVAWLGLSETVIPFERQARAAGTTKYPLWKMVRFAWTAITSFSAMPLQMTVALGILACCLAFGYLVFAGISAMFFKNVVWGWTSLVFLQCFFFGITLICLGLIGDYVAKIYEEIKFRPLYVIGQAFNTAHIHASLKQRVIMIDSRVPSRPAAD